MINFENVGNVYSSYDYDWSCIGVWRGSDGYYYIATDSGCSCNSPFEYLNDEESNLIEEYGAIGLTSGQAITELKSLVSSGYNYDDSDINELLMHIV